MSAMEEEQEKTTIEQQQKMTMKKVIACKITEEEFQKTILPTMYGCYDLEIIDRQTVSAFVKFCINFWIGHYRTKKQPFEMSQQEIEQEGKKKLAAIAAEKEQAYEKRNKSLARVIEKATKQVEELGEQLEREFAETHPSSSPKQQPRKQQPTTEELLSPDV